MVVNLPPTMTRPVGSSISSERPSPLKPVVPSVLQLAFVMAPLASSTAKRFIEVPPAVVKSPVIMSRPSECCWIRSTALFGAPVGVVRVFATGS